MNDHIIIPTVLLFILAVTNLLAGFFQKDKVESEASATRASIFIVGAMVILSLS